MSDLLQDIADVVEELCDPHQHIEPVWEWDAGRNKSMRRVYTTVQDGLLRQLADMFTAASGEPVGSASKSKPPAHWDALSRHTVITLAAAKWCWDLQVDQRSTVEGNIRSLVGAPMDSDQRHQLRSDLNRWRSWARIVTGWDTPPFNPPAPCPALTEDEHGEPKDCGKTMLRINLSNKTAYCASCGATWDHTTIGLLAETVRAYRKASEAAAKAARLRARETRNGAAA